VKRIFIFSVITMLIAVIIFCIMPKDVISSRKAGAMKYLKKITKTKNLLMIIILLNLIQKTL